MVNHYLKSWPSLTDLGITVEQGLHRIGLRGTWRLNGTDDGLRLDWVTTGQRGNPFAPSVVVEGSDLAALVAEVLARTEPERGGLDWTVPWCLRERERAAEERKRHAARMAKLQAELDARKELERQERERRRRQNEARRVLG